MGFVKCKMSHRGAHALGSGGGPRGASPGASERKEARLPTRLLAKEVTAFWSPATLGDLVPTSDVTAELLILPNKLQGWRPPASPATCNSASRAPFWSSARYGGGSSGPGAGGAPGILRPQPARW